MTIQEACNRITQITADVAFKTRDMPQISHEDLKKQVGELALAVNRLNLCVRNLADGKKEGGPAF